MILERICSQKEGGNKDVQEAKFLNHIFTLTKDLGVLLHLDAWSINILKARTAKKEKNCVKLFLNSVLWNKQQFNCKFWETSA